MFSLLLNVPQVMAAITAEQQKLDDEAQYLKDTRVKTGQILISIW